VPPCIEVEAAGPCGEEDEEQRSVERHREHDIRELRRRLRCQRAQRNCDDEPLQSSTDRGDNVETRLDQLARSVPQLFHNSRRFTSTVALRTKCIKQSHTRSSAVPPYLLNRSTAYVAGTYCHTSTVLTHRSLGPRTTKTASPVF